MDADSSRYLLSAIVQALAALLAIIFAGVAILWGQESQAISKLEELKPKYNVKLEFRGRYFGGSLYFPSVEAIRVLLERLFLEKSAEVKRSVLSIAKKTDETPLSTFRKVSSWSIYLGTPYSMEQIQESIEKVANIYRQGREPIEIKGEEEFISSTRQINGFFNLTRNMIDYVEFYKNEFDVANHFQSILGRLEPMRRWLINDGVENFVQAIVRGKTSRGPWFKALISLYAITIAGGMVLLSILKKGVLALQATWYAAGPLLFAIGAVALTFYYLARIVSGEKDG